MPSPAERLRGLAAWEPALVAPGFSAGHWVESEVQPDGVLQVGWFAYSPEARRLVADLYALEWVYDFDWMRWAGSARGRRLRSGPDALASASEADLRKVLTAYVRGDRFSEGELAGAFEAGIILAAVRRARALLADGGT